MEILEKSQSSYVICIEEIKYSEEKRKYVQESKGRQAMGNVMHGLRSSLRSSNVVATLNCACWKGWQIEKDGILDAILVKIYLKNAVDKMTSKTILTNRNGMYGQTKLKRMTFWSKSAYKRCFYRNGRRNYVENDLHKQKWKGWKRIFQ